MSKSNGTPTNEGRFFTVAELAEHLRLSRRTVERAIWAGDLEHYRLGARIIINETAVNTWLGAHRVGKSRIGRKHAL